MRYTIIDTQDRLVIGEIIGDDNLTNDDVMYYAGFQYEYSESWQMEGWTKNGGETVYEIGNGCKIITTHN